jgi:hypothetical protein
MASVDLEGAVVLSVGRVRIGLNQVAKNVETFLGVEIDSLSVRAVDVASVDGISDSSLVVLDSSVAVGVPVVAIPLAIVVEVLVEVGIVGPRGERQTVGVLERWVISSLERYFVVEVLDFTETIGETFKIVPS